MNDISRKVVSYLILGVFISLSIIFIVSLPIHARDLNLQTFPARFLKLELILLRALITTLNFIPPAIILTFVFSFTVLFTLGPFQTRSYNFSSISIPSYIILLIFMTFTIWTQLILQPRLHSKCEWLQYNSRVLSSALNRSKELYRASDYKKALSTLRIILDVDENNPEAIELSQKIRGVMQKVYPIREQEKFSGEEEGEAKLEKQGYYERGKEEYEKGNYYYALFYLERALTLHKDNVQINQLYQRTRKKVDGLIGSLTEEEERMKKFLQQKEKALEFLNNKDFYRAYSIFVPLSKKFPHFEDLKLYIKEIEKELLKEDFFSIELDEKVWFPSYNNLIFFDSRGYIDTVERIIPYRGNYYFYNIKRFRIKGSSVEERNWKYGKWIKNKIRLKNKEGLEKIPEEKFDEYYIVPYVEPPYLLFINEPQKLKQQLNIYNWVNQWENLKKSGVDISSHFHYISHKLGILFSIYVISLFLAGLGWTKRSIYEFPPVGKLILFFLVIPLFVYFIDILYTDMNGLIIYSHRYFTRYIIHNINLIFYTLLINTLFALISTLYFFSRGGTSSSS